MTEDLERLNAAARRLAEGSLAEAIRLFEQLAAESPHLRGVCMAQIGAAYYRLGDFGRAIACYEYAAAQGVDDEMMRDNLDLARDGIIWRKLRRGEGF